MVEAAVNQNESPQELAAKISTVEDENNPYAFYDKIGRPKYLVAPMVDQSELPYRMLTRRYGAQLKTAQLCYTPMFHSRLFSQDPKYRAQMFQPCAEDRPLTVQFCGNDPDILLAAAKYVENDCDAVDINLGCPQGIAKKEKKDLIVSMVRKLKAELKVPVTCKIRCLPTEEQTLDLAMAIQEAGASLLTVHGRCKEHNKHRVGSANYDMIRKIKQALSIPVIANGGIGTYEDVERALELTGCDGVMSSESILEYPALYDPSQIYDMDELMLEYLDLFERYPGEGDLKSLKSHMYKFLYVGLQKHTDIRDVLNQAKGFEPIKQVAVLMKERRKDERVEDKIGWYYRHWRNMGLERSVTKTYSVEPWDEQCIKDPLLNKALQPPKAKRQKTKSEQTGQQNQAQNQAASEAAAAEEVKQGEQNQSQANPAVILPEATVSAPAQEVEQNDAKTSQISESQAATQAAE